MSSLLWNFFPTDLLPPHQFSVNGERTQKQVVTQKTITREGTMNCNFFPTDMLPPFQLPADGDMTSQTIHQAEPAQEKTNKFKGTKLQIQQVHSQGSKSIPVYSSSDVLGSKTNGSKQTKAFFA